MLLSLQEKIILEFEEFSKISCTWEGDNCLFFPVEGGTGRICNPRCDLYELYAAPNKLYVRPKIQTFKSVKDLLPTLKNLIEHG
jgi:hypothetical protein